MWTLNSPFEKSVVHSQLNRGLSELFEKIHRWPNMVTSRSYVAPDQLAPVGCNRRSESSGPWSCKQPQRARGPGARVAQIRARTCRKPHAARKRPPLVFLQGIAMLVGSWDGLCRSVPLQRGAMQQVNIDPCQRSGRGLDFQR